MKLGFHSYVQGRATPTDGFRRLAQHALAVQEAAVRVLHERLQRKRARTLEQSIVG